MSERSGLHPDEMLQDLVDGRASGDERLAVEAHLAGCIRCQRLRDSLLATRRLLRAAPVEATPAELGAVLQRAITEGTGAAAPAERSARIRRQSWVLATATAAALVLVLGGMVARWRAAEPDPVDQLVGLRAAASLTFLDRDPAALEGHLAAALPFRPRVLDLAPMGVRLSGGGTVTVAGVPAALMAYITPDRGRLLCVMWRGHLAALPAEDSVRRRAPFTFRV
ncbi:MAG TPA: zf-HC2 domain-containing protein, partial [Thermoanaerobaculia bacterium]|nr:zf-HC2 domain-containing protein [Thermoanaerobaculia bacterium]